MVFAFILRMPLSTNMRNLEQFRLEARAGVWDENLFSYWLKEATVSDWATLEELWQRAHCSDLLNWSLLRSSLEYTAQKENVSSFDALSSFLYPAHGLGYEGYWLDWQEPEVRSEVYRTAQTWLECVSQPTAQQALVLLNIARDAQCMALWRTAPDSCVASLEWHHGMRALNHRASLDDLNLDDIRRVPTHHLFDHAPFWESAMVTCYEVGFRTVARFLEIQAGPGLWIQYVMDGSARGYEMKRRRAWENMKLDGVDAWALSEYIRPSASFEKSLADLGDRHTIHDYSAWAKRWWIECQLGMPPMHALALAKAIQRGTERDMLVEYHEVPNVLFESPMP